MELNGNQDRRSGQEFGNRPGPGQALPQAQTLKTMAGALMGAPVLLAIVLWFAADPDAEVSWLVIGVVLAIGAVIGATVPFLDRNISPLPAGHYGEQAQQQGLQRYQAAFFRTFALCEVPMFAGLVGMFVTDSVSIWHFVAGAAVTLLLMAMYVWPSRTTVQRAQQRLDRDGGQSQLLAAFGY